MEILFKDRLESRQVRVKDSAACIVVLLLCNFFKNSSTSVAEIHWFQSAASMDVKYL